MSSPRITTRQRLIEAALELFATQGVTKTTTRQIAELAQVNEVTLFRHFGNKHGLLLAALSDSAVLQQLREFLRTQVNQTSSAHQALKDYASDRLQILVEQVPEFVRSVVAEAGQYPRENRQALGQFLNQANHYVAEYLTTVMEREHLRTQMPAEKLASLVISMLLGYAAIEFTTEFHELWHDRDDFLDDLVEMLLSSAVLENNNNYPVQQRIVDAVVTTEEVADLPANLVHLILQRAKKSGLRDYALIYVLFATGLSPVEIVNLERSHQINNNNQYLLQITQGMIRQVPVNQWIMGKRYGSYTRNPLTQWLKSRKDEQAALFLNSAGMPIAEEEIQSSWQIVTEELLTPEGQPPVIEQAQHTWRVEMLMKGISLEDLCILTGCDLTTLEPYVRRAREKLALEQAIRLDHKS